MHLLRQTVKRRRRRRHTRQLLHRRHHPSRNTARAGSSSLIEDLGAVLRRASLAARGSAAMQAAHAAVVALWIDVLDQHRDAELVRDRPIDGSFGMLGTVRQNDVGDLLSDLPAFGSRGLGRGRSAASASEASQQHEDDCCERRRRIDRSARGIGVLEPRLVGRVGDLARIGGRAAQDRHASPRRSGCPRIGRVDGCAADLG